jgi:hypothetical protein
MTWKPFAAGFVLLLLVVGAYVPATGGGSIWDDDHYVSENADLRSAAGLWRIWMVPQSSPQYYPLVFSSLWIEYHLWGLWPAGYHVVNVLLHGVNAILLWRVLARLQVPGAWFAAALFALHPVEVESVAWITERKNVLSGLFYFAAALCYWRFCPPEEVPSFGGRRPAWYGVALLLFGAALLSKTVTASLPVALALIAWWKRGKLSVRDGLALLPFVALGIALGLGTVWLEKHHVGAAGQEWSLTVAQRLIIASRALTFYAGKLFWPVDLTFIYPRWEIDPTDWRLYLYPLGVVGLFLLLWATRWRWGRGPLVACLFFAGTLVPALGFFDVYPMRYSFVADHFQYLASAGLLSLAAAGCVLGWQRLRPELQRLRYLAGGVVLLLLALLTWGQGYIYRDEPTLWEDTLVKNPSCWLAHNALGKEYYQHGLYREAEEHFAAALTLIPVGWTETQAKAYSNRGVMRQAQGKLEEAQADYEQAMALDPNNPSFHLNLEAVQERLRMETH